MSRTPNPEFITVPPPPSRRRRLMSSILKMGGGFVLVSIAARAVTAFMPRPDEPTPIFEPIPCCEPIDLARLRAIAQTEVAISEAARKQFDADRSGDKFQSAKGSSDRLASTDVVASMSAALAHADDPQLRAPLSKIDQLTRRRAEILSSLTPVQPQPKASAIIPRDLEDYR